MVNVGLGWGGMGSKAQMLILVQTLRGGPSHEATQGPASATTYIPSCQKAQLTSQLGVFR